MDEPHPEPHLDAPAARVEAALKDLIAAFATDDYALSVTSFDDRVLRLAIEAGPSACAECLVPPPMLAGLVRNTLPPELAVADIAIRYPEGTKLDAAADGGVVEAGFGAEHTA